MNLAFRKLCGVFAKVESMNCASGLSAYETPAKKAKVFRPEYPKVYSRKYFKKKKPITS